MIYSVCYVAKLQSIWLGVSCLGSSVSVMNYRAIFNLLAVVTRCYRVNVLFCCRKFKFIRPCPTRNFSKIEIQNHTHAPKTHSTRLINTYHMDCLLLLASLKVCTCSKFWIYFTLNMKKRISHFNIMWQFCLANWQHQCPTRYCCIWIYKQQGYLVS